MGPKPSTDRPHRVLAFDPGATRAGWAVLEEGRYISSGVVYTPRPKVEKFQDYRLRLTDEWWNRAEAMLLNFWPTIVVNETVPSRGMGIFEQIYLTAVQIACVHCAAARWGIPIRQVAARTVQSVIAIKGKSKGVTKPQVRNGVLERLPELQPRLKELTKSKVFEETDALAIALWYYKEVNI